jgi:hypothetical protein
MSVSDAPAGTHDEWTQFLAALRITAGPLGGFVDPNAVRELLRGVVAPRRIGAFYQTALKSGLLRPTGEWSVSDDAPGGNAGKPCRIYRLGESR